MDDLNKFIDEVVQDMNESSLFDEETKDEMLKLLAEVKSNPTKGNLETLAYVLDKLGQADRYLAAQELLSTVN